MLLLKDIILSEDGRRVDYYYEATGAAVRFFKDRPSFFIIYDRDVSACPRSILAIPFVTNFEPIGWFAGFDVHVPELDSSFASSRPGSREAFARMYSGKVKDFGVRPKQLVTNEIKGDKHLMLFSGGLDATASLLRHMQEPLVLVTVKGADITLDDYVQWEQCLRHISTTPISANYERSIIVSNLREFYADDVDAVLLFSWWGRVQHGHALLGLLAPLSAIVGAKLCYIASSYNIPMSWGSTLEIDQKLTWDAVRCIHDAASLSRQQKAELVVLTAAKTNQGIQLRVCYSEVQRDGNCGHCEKCYRTILNIILSGADPRDFGLPMYEVTYANIFKLMKTIRPSRGLITFWQEISSAANTALKQKKYFVLADAEDEERFIKKIASGEINKALASNLSPLRDELARLKFIARVKLPRLYRIYRFIADRIRKTLR